MFFFHFQETIPLCKLYLIIFQIFKWWKHHLARSGFHFKKLSFWSFKENSPVSQPGSTWKDDQAKDNGKCPSRVLSCLWSGTLILWQRKVLNKLIIQCFYRVNLFLWQEKFWTGWLLICFWSGTLICVTKKSIKQDDE